MPLFYEQVHSHAAPPAGGGAAMIAGIGVDMAAVARVQRSLANPAFLRRVYGPAEQQALLALSPARRAEHAAAAWAAKEAFGKALGCGLQGLALREVQLLHDDAGAPYLALAGAAAALAAARGVRPLVSITHEGGFAVAFVLLQTSA